MLIEYILHGVFMIKEIFIGALLLIGLSESGFSNVCVCKYERNDDTKTHEMKSTLYPWTKETCEDKCQSDFCGPRSRNTCISSSLSDKTKAEKMDEKKAKKKQRKVNIKE